MLNLDVAELQGITIISLSGRLSSGPELPAIGQKVKSLTALGQRKFIIDLTEVDFIDSAGVGELVAAFSSVKKAGGLLKLAGATKMVREVLRLTRITTIVESFDGRPDAIASFDSSAASNG